MLQVFDQAQFSKVVHAPSSMDEANKNKIREYAKIIKAKNELLSQVKKMDDMIQLIDGKSMQSKLWVNQKGDVIPIFDIDDDYLKNIYAWCLKNSREVSVQIKKEYLSRFGELPTNDEEGNKYAPAAKKKSFKENPYNSFYSRGGGSQSWDDGDF